MIDISTLDELPGSLRTILYKEIPVLNGNMDENSYSYLLPNTRHPETVREQCRISAPWKMIDSPEETQKQKSKRSCPFLKNLQM